MTTDVSPRRTRRRRKSCAGRRSRAPAPSPGLAARLERRGQPLPRPDRGNPRHGRGAAAPGRRRPGDHAEGAGMRRIASGRSPTRTGGGAGGRARRAAARDLAALKEAARSGPNRGAADHRRSAAERTGSTGRLIAERFGAWAAGYFDQGQALWAAPRGGGAYAVWRAVATHDRTPEIAGLPASRCMSPRRRRPPRRSSPRRRAARPREAATGDLFPSAADDARRLGADAR